MPAVMSILNAANALSPFFPHPSDSSAQSSCRVPKGLTAHTVGGRGRKNPKSKEGRERESKHRTRLLGCSLQTSHPMPFDTYSPPPSLPPLSLAGASKRPMTILFSPDALFSHRPSRSPAPGQSKSISKSDGPYMHACTRK